MSECRIPWGTSRSDDRQILLAKHLSIRDRLAVYMMSFNIMSRSSSLKEVCISNLYLLHKMMHGPGDIAGIPLAAIIIDYILEVARTKREKKVFVFPILISRLLVSARVDIDNEVTRRTTDSDQLTERTLVQMGYECVNGQWRKKSEEREALQEREAPQVQDDRVHAEQNQEVVPPLAPTAQPEVRPKRFLLLHIYTSCRSMGREIRENKAAIDELQRNVLENWSRMERVQSTFDILVQQQQM